MPGADFVSETYVAPFVYRTCRPNEYLVKTGLGVSGEVVCKKTYQWPMQRVTVISLTPRNYEFTLHCVSKDLVPFELPVVFTCGPYNYEHDQDGFKRYVSRMCAMDGDEIRQTVIGVIHGQTRLYAAALTVMEMFNDRDSFKVKVQEHIEKELQSFGLQVFNGNIAEMKDKQGQDYFESLKQKAISGATNAARVATAEANKLGDVGEWQRKSEVAMEKKRVDAEQASNNNKQEESITRSNLELQKVKVDCDQQLKMQQVEADMAPKQRSIENDTQLQILEAKNQQENLRATKLAKTIVEAEQTIKAAEAAAEAKKKQADANLYSRQKEAEAQLVENAKHAEGIAAIARAQAEALRQLEEAATPDMVKFYLGLQSGFFKEMADSSAAAIQGLQPKINVWNTGSQADKDGSTFAPLRNLFTTIPPMADALESQAGMKMPSWMPNNDSGKADFVEVPAVNGTHKPAGRT